ncbi:MAG: aldo/keto reductase [Candidatus Saccharibacteria bacterium]|nr:aldo/keto reductase [Candidatus Saccharibacteria bacterium]
MSSVYRERLPGTDLEVSDVAFGTYKLGMKLGAAAAVELMGYAYYFHGINMIDTSDNYPEAEALIGQAFRGKALIRDDIVIASKTGLATSQEEANEFHARGRRVDTSPERIEKKIEESLTTMGIDEIDLYQAHAYDPNVEPVYLAYTMNELIQKGKIRHWGVCNYTVEQVEELLEVCRQNGLITPATYQQYHNLAGRPFEKDIKGAKAKGLGTLAFSPLARGALTDEYATGFYAQQREIFEEIVRLSTISSNENKINYENAHVLLQLHKAAQEKGLSLQQLALAWLVSNEDIDVTLLGAYNKEHLEELMQVTEWMLDKELQTQADLFPTKLSSK